MYMYMYILFMDDDSKHKVDDSDDGCVLVMDVCLILNKLGRRKVKLCQRVMVTLRC